MKTLDAQKLTFSLRHSAGVFILCGALFFPATQFAANQEQTFTNSTSISVSASNGAVLPFPSEISVNGAEGAISQLTVTLYGVSHAWPADLNVTVMGPQGRSVALFSDTGDGFAVSGVRLTFDDAAAEGLPADDVLMSGLWRPNDALSVFSSTSPNGVWRLLIADDYPPADGGAVAGGWSLSLVTTNVLCANTSAVDLVVTQQGAPNPVALSNTVTYTITVTNRGPAVATGVALVNTLSPEAHFLTATTSQGSCSNAAGVVNCELGALPPGAGAAVQIQVKAIGGPTLMSTAAVQAAEIDCELSNNEMTTSTAVFVPWLSIANSSVVEGDSGSRQMEFLVWLSEPAGQRVEMDYRTVPVTARIGADFIAQTNRLQFEPGNTEQTFSVMIPGDVLNEDDETFRIELFNPRNAALANTEATGSILNDDPLPALSISDAQVVEGNGGMTSAIFTVNLSAASGRAVSVTCSTSNGTARAGSDYVGISQRTVTFQPGQLSANFTVQVMGDTEVERDETFLVQLSGPSNAVLGRATGQGTILTDDLAPSLAVAEYRVIAESQSPPNRTVDHGETVTVSLDLRNDGSTDVTNLVVTLLGDASVQNPSGPQSYGLVTAGGPPVSRSFTFTAAVTNSGPLHGRLHLQDGATDLGTTPFVVQVGGGQEFIIHSLSVSGSHVLDDITPLIWDDRGGVALSSNRVFVTGDSNTAHFALSDLSGGTRIAPRYDGLVSDLRSERVYSFGDGNIPLNVVLSPAEDGFCATVNSLLELDGATGVQTGTRINLSTPIRVSLNSGVFAGYGRIVLHNGVRVYDIDPSSGHVTDLGAMAVPLHRRSESWAYWGVAEFFNGAVHLVCVQDARTIVRIRVPDGAPTPIATFGDIVDSGSHLGDMASFTVSPRLGRWYFRYELSALFDRFDQAFAPAFFISHEEKLGYADALMSTPSLNSAPVILRQPKDRSVIEGSNATFTVVTSSSRPQRYQWQFEGHDLPGGTTDTLTLSAVNRNEAGRYSVVVSNAYGMVTSAVATLTVVDPNSDLFDDFDPDIELAQWSAFGGTIGRPVVATNYGGYVSSPNSLWFGNRGSRFAVTRPLNTSRGGTISFDLRVAEGTNNNWIQGELIAADVVLEFSTNSGTSWVLIGGYTSTNYYSWQHVSLGIPTAAQGPATLFRWRQWVVFRNGEGHWALDNVAITTNPAQVEADAQKMRVEDAALGRELQRQGAELVADYGNFQLLVVPSSVAQAFARHPGLFARDDDNVIELHARRLDTRRAEVRAQRKAAGNFAGKRLHLIHFAGPLKPEWHRQLKAHGVEIVSYLPHNAYLVYGNAPSLRRLQAHATAARHVQWEGDYLPDYKANPLAQAAALKATAKEKTEDQFAIQLVADDLANTDTLELIDRLKLAPLLKKAKVLNYLNVIVRLPPDKLAELAARPDVISIQVYRTPQKRDERQGQILAGNLIGDVPAGPGYLAWLTSKGFTPEQFAASGFAVDVSDSGIDNGTLTPNHPGLYSLGNANLGSRVAYNRLLGWSNTRGTIAGCDGHGTLNAHIVAGYNDLTGFPHTDAEGYRYGLGIAPFVRVGGSVVFDPSFFTTPDYAELQSRAYADGARISCNSWGADAYGEYTIDSQQYDALVRDAQPDNSPFPTPGNQGMVILFAAGNAGPLAGSVATPGSAKNVICVGAAENVHPHSTASGGDEITGDDGCGLGDAQADNANEMALFSSRGPCDDGRIKPDLVGPGTHVTGGVAQEQNPAANGTAASCFNTNGVCGLRFGGFFPQGQQFYTTSSGTSHSTPAIGGGAALLRQYFINNYWLPPSPAMTKAWLMNSARYLTGVSASDTLPSIHQGMGSMNLGMAFDGVSRVRRDQLEADWFTASGQVRVFAGAVANPNRPLRVTLAWTDAPGSTIGNAYNNDLDLTVAVGGQTYRGNVFNRNLSMPGGVADPRNNVESVFLPPGLAGPITVTVTAANINSDGVPGNADALDQDFALVIYNARESGSLELVSAGAVLRAESCPPANQSIDPAETVSVELTLENVGASATSALVGTLLPNGGVTAPSAPQNYGVLSSNGGRASRLFSFMASAACGSAVIARLQLQDGTNDLGIVEFRFPVGTLATNEYAVTNSAPITINTSNSTVVPYPSEIIVNDAEGVIDQLMVTLHGFGHTWPADLDATLIGPQGQSVALLSGAGDGFAVSDLTLTFGDFASDTPPYDDVLTSGIWRPASPLSVFAGANPNGVWRLFIADDYPANDGGALAGGWSLAFATSNRVCCMNPSSVDLALTQRGTPPSAALSNVVTYTITVTNSGPAIATGVALTDTLSTDAVFLSATASQGSCLHTAGVVRCDLGSLPPGVEAVVLIQVSAAAGPMLTSTAEVSAAELDRDLSNNYATSFTPVQVPLLSIADAGVVEGDSGTRSAVFLVSLSEASAQTVTVDYRTMAGTATAGADFLAQSNRLHFLPGEIVREIVMPVVGDLLNEDDEIFRIELFNPHNAALAHAEAIGTILNDDPLPAFSITDAQVVEGNSGTTSAIFTVNLSAASGRAVSVTCSTSNGTARAGSDYHGIAGQRITLQSGQLSTNFTVPVTGDTEIERNETFLVQLSNPGHAMLGRATAQGTILTDDLAPLVTVTGYRVIAESQSPPNRTVNPAETVTVSLDLRNDGSTDITNLVVTMVGNASIQNPSGPQSYGRLTAGGPSVSRLFTFTAADTNCGPVHASLLAQDGAAALSTIPWVVDVGGGQEFFIQSLSASGFRVLPWPRVENDKSLALSGSNVFASDTRFPQDLSRFVNLDQGYAGLVSDLRTETVYSLGDGDRPIAPGAWFWFDDDDDDVEPSPRLGTPVNSLLELDGNTGALTGRRINLTTPLRMWSGAGVFAGFGRIVLHNGVRVYDIDPNSGHVTDLGAMSPPLHQSSLGWAYWGVAEFFDGAVHLVYVKNSNTIVRTRVPDGSTTTLASFNDLGTTAAITVSPRLGRWYFYFKGKAQFGNGDSGLALGYADAVMTLPCSHSPPSIVRQSTHRWVMTGASATFTVEAASNRPLRYQWQFNGRDIIGATSPTLTLTSATTNEMGGYAVILSNGFGAVTSAMAFLTVVEPSSGLFDDFDAGIDGPQWSAFGGTVGSTVVATNFAGYVSGPNALWFDDNGSRFATTRPVNTSHGGAITFELRLAGPSGANWQRVYLPEQGIVLEYSANGGANWSELGRYTDTAYYNWTRAGLDIPAAAQGPAMLFRWRQLSHGDGMFGTSRGNWALDNVLIGAAPRPPFIQTHPTNQVASMHWPARFTVLAGGTPPLFYQWRFNGRDIAGGTNATLWLTSTTTNDAGAYSVVARNAHGTETSSVVTLTVIPSTNSPLLLLSALLSPDGVQLRLGHADGGALTPARAAHIQVLMTTNLALPFSQWTALTNPRVLTNGWLRMDGIATTNTVQRFFRAVEVLQNP